MLKYVSLFSSLKRCHLRHALAFTLVLLAADIAVAQDGRIPILGERGFVFAHRGGRFEFEENTLTAFKNSYEKGLRGFETDVRLSKDGQFFILHDDNLNRTTTSEGHVEHKTADELRQVKTKGGNSLPAIVDLLDYLSDKPVYLELEMKTSNKELYPDECIEEYASKLLELVKAKTPKGAKYVFTSFDERPLKAIRRLDPTVEMLFITSDGCTPENVQKTKSIGAQRLGCNVNKTTRDQVRAAHKAGILVSLWPGLSIEDYQLGFALGADSLCTDIPVQLTAWIKANFSVMTMDANPKK